MLLHLLLPVLLGMLVQNKIQTSITIVDNYWHVAVMQFKFDTIRQESYWCVKHSSCKSFKTLKAAESYAARIEKE